MSKQSISKKIAKKAARRAERKLPVHDSGSDPLAPLADLDVVNAEAVVEQELDERGNPVGTVYNEDGSIFDGPIPPVIEPLP